MDLSDRLDPDVQKTRSRGHRGGETAAGIYRTSQTTLSAKLPSRSRDFSRLARR